MLEAHAILELGTCSGARALEHSAAGPPMECGFYVATWLERQILKIAGKPLLEVTAKVNVRQLKGRLLKMLCCWGPTMKRLQAEVPKPAEPPVEDPAPGGDAADDMLEELRSCWRVPCW